MKNLTLTLATLAILAGCETVPSATPPPVGETAKQATADVDEVGFPTGYFRMQTMFLEAENKCLEGNQFDPGATLGGGAFMDNCQDVSGQFWKAIPEGEYFRLTTMFREGEGECFEGNKFAPTSTLAGAAFMDACQNVSGQLWRVTPEGNGYYRLTTMFQEGDGKCLEGNKFAEGSTLGGAAFMDDCQNVSGQMWTFVPE